ncbi:tRNA (guanine-N1)-methyltransferase [Thermosipho melanesiensis]|uniref:tRNA (guanine-N(1)-)-methyltransferase n=2 Tax=Thermosipho melanesiensis TaxID=46541 RepID=TRMD_THEM4|nr:tRNA (guanosine(37)-N1)-methyltransferase TrmD [Thermosipho melanesiensis]A6LNY6.1 RecName: Full=tRNA (guanine-N(1)-)-methyltransferase; AltName: Full=M1G-methyltransferase; AltName: Full=tRNA [GM37] methyltransferase [Thermosipho melanesiensis BI429]ABR31637.1 tRNA (guanine-N1)-methyltransferase [Thermosipho melanesiensis BI429]APT74666.1 tRNA (guanine-N1)-methyltransferase [Thermosipho melanesiensis]OOC35165.1 tRNA (guanine-N1)-methyltransferase [Thermosipho melanesiensis]OOC35375.1 tRNA 
MRISILTIFPEMVEIVKKYGVISRAIKNGILEIEIFNLRDFTNDKHKTVDDYPFGGGPGMVMKPEPFFNFFEYYKERYGNTYTILTSPQGDRLTNHLVKELSEKESILIICGRYEGIDERVTKFVDREISIGDYVLTGGELPAMVIVDAVSRFIPDVIDKKSVEQETFNTGLLDHPHYTRPRNYKGLEVPEVLLSGDHKKIEIWRRKMALKKTMLKRPDLFLNKDLDGVDKVALLDLFRELINNAK